MEKARENAEDVILIEQLYDVMVLIYVAAAFMKLERILDLKDMNNINYKIKNIFINLEFFHIS